MLDEELRYSIDDLLMIAPADGRDLVRDAYELAASAHAGQKLMSGEDYIRHPVAVATLIAGLRFDATTIAAGLLHDVLEDTEVTRAQLARQFPHDVVRIVEGVTKIGRIKFESKLQAQTENLRKLFLAMAQDVRVVIVKLCDRMHNMRTLRYLTPERRVAMARETLDIFAPLAGRLGMNELKVEFEDNSMRWLYPDDYRELTTLISAKKHERAAQLDAIVAALHERLDPEFENLQIYGRTKHFYSIWKKMKQAGFSFDEIYDLNAVRIICEAREDCYAILGAVHDLWRPIPGRLKDYIGTPKRNGYMSLHTTVMTDDGDVTEVQIRTFDMHRAAEYGIAAHWMYKEAGRSARAVGKVPQVKESLTWVRQLIEGLVDEREPDAFLSMLKRDILDEVVICFSPKGDLYELPKGATPIDFAYLVHTDLGNHCTGATINGKMANLRTPLQSGDVVSIQSHPSGHPSRDWLDDNAVVTSRARQRIRQYLKSRDMATYVQRGFENLQRVIAEGDYVITKAELDSRLGKLAESMRFSTKEDFLAEMGFGGLSAQAMLTRMFPDLAERKRQKPDERKKKDAPAPAEQEGIKRRTARGSAAEVRVAGLENESLSIRFASCCHPVPGEKIVGFITRGRGITVHRKTCNTVERLKTSRADSARLVDVRWEHGEDSFRTVPIRVEADDRSGLLHDLTKEFTQRALFIASCNTKSYQEDKTANFRFEVKVTDSTELDDVITGLRSVKGVYLVERSTRAI